MLYSINETKKLIYCDFKNVENEQFKSNICNCINVKAHSIFENNFCFCFKQRSSKEIQDI